MTISYTSSRVDVNGNGVARVFSFSPMTIFASTDLEVTVRTAAGVETVIAQGNGSTNYSLGVTTFPGTGSITYPATGGTLLPLGDKIVIKRVIPLTQLTDLENQGGYFAEVQETTFDRTVAMIQQQQEQLDRTFTLAETDPAIPLTMPTSTVRANKFLGFDGSGNPQAMSGVSSAAVSAAMEAVVAAASTTAALALLGVATVATVAALRAITSTTHASGMILLKGYYADKDGGEGLFIVGTTVADDHGTVFVDASGRAWHRMGMKDARGYSVRWFGAKGDAATNDYTAIQRAIDYCGTNGVGPVHFSSGYYKTGTQLSVNTNGLVLVGDGIDKTVLEVSAAGMNLLTIAGSRNGVERMLLNNPYFETSAVAILTLDTAVETVVEDVYIAGGNPPVQIIDGSADNVFERCIILNSYGGQQVLLRSGSGTYFNRCKIDQAWPYGPAPAAAAVKGARANTTAYNAGDLVSLSGFYIQCTIAGTSGASPPTLLKYNDAIVDGTVTWKLACATGLVGALVDSGSNYNLFFQCDFTGAYRGGVHYTNSLATTAPQKNVIRDTEVGSLLEFGIRGDAGAGLIIDGATVNALVLAAGTAIDLGAAWTGDATIQGCLIYAAGIGIQVSGGTNADVRGNQVFGCTTAGIRVIANVNRFSITDNTAGTSATWGTNLQGIIVAAGTSDNYAIVGNNTRGATTGLTDGGGGANKILAGNV